ncbi:lipocalin family protein [Natronoflexus pectinivorans]|uniref:Lipocalin-like protein n=1 Tax=Natronoflexus pectinivorans TaxID=682526 RepID=A0A4R2GQ50_9BACT|nr:lipocalin family protein [Natronoflexus pectinivorans]TCO10839.1 lipocalin-like protein [Natronoflexus pectinivorans]
MKIYIKYILLSVALVFVLASCSSDSKKEEVVRIEGLWKILEERFQSNEDDSWVIMFPEDNENIQPYMLFDNNLYTYYEVKNNEDTLDQYTKTGSYSINRDTLIISYTGSERVERTHFIINGNKLTQKLSTAVQGEELVIISEKIREVEPPVADEPNDEDEDQNGDQDQPDSGNLEDLHDQNSAQGSNSNPVRINLNQVIDNSTQNIVDTLDTQITQYRYYIKAEPNKTYNVRVFNVSTDFSDLPSRLQYLQVLVTDVPFPIDGINQKTEFRIRDRDNELIEGNSKELTTTTGYIYVEVFRYNEDDELSFSLEVKEAE